MRIAEAKINAARNNRKAAFSAYLPSIDASGGYIYNSREISLLNDNLKSSLPQMGTALQQSLGAVLATNPALGQLLASLGNIDLATPLNNLGQQIVDEFRTDTRNMWVGNISLTQPLYLGGKLRAYNKITRYAEELAQSQQNTAAQEIVYQVDELYWQVVSLTHKKRLAESYAALLDSLQYNIRAMIEEGVATQSDGLTVAVKSNEAQISLTQVDNGLSLARWSWPDVRHAHRRDLHTGRRDMEPETYTAARHTLLPDMESVFANRSEIQSLTLAGKIFQNKQKIALSGMLPTVALTGNYMISNPNLFNGFEREFKGFFNVGVTGAHTPAPLGRQRI